MEGRGCRDILGKKWIMSAVEGRELWSQREARERRVHRGLHKENSSPKPLTGKTKEIDFHEF